MPFVGALCRLTSSFKWAVILKYRCCKSWLSQKQMENTTEVRFFFLDGFMSQCYARYLVSDSLQKGKSSAAMGWEALKGEIHAFF